jgi:hypothetical protein
MGRALRPTKRLAVNFLASGGVHMLALVYSSHFRLHGISDRVRMENENLWRPLGPLVPAMQSGKIKSEFVEVLSVDPFLGDYEMPYTGPNKGMFLSIEYLSDACPSPKFYLQ